jgi:hypothetical protein
MTQCTWQDPPDARCTAEATHPQVATDGEVWANLCDAHDTQLNNAINDPEFNPRRMLSHWVRAAGGATKMTERMIRGYDRRIR